jgi:transcriptional regulator GlxA family with amidase domain
VLPLTPEDVLGSALSLLFAEASARECGRQAALDRLAEVVLIYMLRRLMDAPEPGYGLLAGLAHPALGRALTRIHADPGGAWTLERMADEAGMSRSVFAETFRHVVGLAPGDYLTRWRLSLARALLQAGRPAKAVARQVGYASPAAFSRAFARHFGRPARQVGRGDAEPEAPRPDRTR